MYFATLPLRSTIYCPCSVLKSGWVSGCLNQESTVQGHYRTSRLSRIPCCSYGPGHSKHSLWALPPCYGLSQNLATMLCGSQPARGGHGLLHQSTVPAESRLWVILTQTPDMWVRASRWFQPSDTLNSLSWGPRPSTRHKPSLLHPIWTPDS